MCIYICICIYLHIQKHIYTYIDIIIISHILPYHTIDCITLEYVTLHTSGFVGTFNICGRSGFHLFGSRSQIVRHVSPNSFEMRPTLMFSLFSCKVWYTICHHLPSPSSLHSDPSIFIKQQEILASLNLVGWIEPHFGLPRQSQEPWQWQW